MYCKKSWYPALLPVLFFIITGCNSSESTHFVKHLNTKTGIEFSNDLNYTKALNPYTYRNFYNGGGVGIGDFNNDGLDDIYFTGNNVENKLYLNNGNFTFTDITDKAGVSSENSWSTGVSIVDINGDDLLDIYVTKSGIPGSSNRHNELFINQGDSTFSEQAGNYGLDITGLHTHAVFFDYDLDGDLDVYLLKNSFKSLAGLEMLPDLRETSDPKGGNAFFENKGGIFVNITEKSGIFSSKIGFGLGATVSDINKDGWPDVYISNDFFERDYFYINDKGKGFKESLTSYLQSISLSSMGADIADLNHDGYPEIFVTDMLPEPQDRLKSKIHFYTWNYYQKSLESGYHYQFARNTLQLNNRNGSFSEIGRLTGVDATDWSWAALIADFDLNGFQDIFVANGIYKDLTDQDYIQRFSDPRAVMSVMGKDTAITKLIDKMPSQPLPNYMFAGYKNMAFKNRAKEWNLGDPGFSNGSAYADLDNDGDLDLVTNNVNSPAGIYENKMIQKHTDRHWLKLKLKGEHKNTSAIGSKIYAWASGKLYYREQFPARGFQSSISHIQHIGLGNAKKVDSLWIIWPDQSTSKRYDLTIDTMLVMNQKYADKTDLLTTETGDSLQTPLLKNITNRIQLKWVHRENSYNDFNRHPLLFHMRSTEGPAVCVADINKDGLDDLYLGGAKEQPGSLWLQKKQGSFEKANSKVFELDKMSEDTDCAFVDINGDEVPELYVTSGGMDFTSSSSALRDRLYVYENGRWIKSRDNQLPVTIESNSVIRPGDFNNDGLTDLFVGTRYIPWKIGQPVNGKLLINRGNGKFADITQDIAPELQEIGMITDARWIDMDQDGLKDLMVTGEWMAINLFKNSGDKFINITEEAGLSGTKGWWNSLFTGDFNNDGAPDFIAGNHGLNSPFKASPQKPVRMYVNDFDYNGSVEQIITSYNGEYSYPVALMDDMIQQLPFLKNRISSYREYGKMTTKDLFDKDVLNKAFTVEVTEMRSVAGWNDGEGRFSLKTLPLREQMSSLYGLLTIDINSDGTKELLTGGNLFEVKPYIGRYDAHKGSVLKLIENKKWESIPFHKSGMYVEGAVRRIVPLETDSGTIIMVIRNNDNPLFFKPKR